MQVKSAFVRSFIISVSSIILLAIYFYKYNEIAGTTQIKQSDCNDAIFWNQNHGGKRAHNQTHDKRWRFTVELDSKITQYINRHSAAIQKLDEILQSGQRNDFQLPKIYRVTFSAGLGNRIPTIICGILYGLLTDDRIVLFNYHYANPSLQDLLSFPVDMDYAKYAKLYDPVESVATLHDKWKISMYKNFTETFNNYKIVNIYSYDYQCPVVYVNPVYRKEMASMFPDADLFYPLASKFISWNSNLLKKVDALYNSQIENTDVFLIGMHIRSGRIDLQGVTAVTYCQLAESIALSQDKPAYVYISADSNEAKRTALDYFEKQEGNRKQIAFSSNVDLSIRDANNNPGASDFDAMVDMLLLSRSSALIVTYVSSFGPVAAGLGGIKRQYFIMPGWNFQDDHVSFWGSVSSEPCFYKSKLIMGGIGSQEDKDMYMKHPHRYHFLQCSRYYDEMK